MRLQFYEGQSFWKSATEYKPGEKLTIEKVNLVEQQLCVKLPKDYVTLMLEQNGGELKYRYVLFEDGDAAIVPYLYEIDVESGVGLSSVFVEECGLPNGIVLLTGDFESWVALDYRKQGAEPGVVYFIGSENGDGSWEEQLIATSFQEFTKKLFQKQATIV
ncbi:SMI1/KNR4 family protein [Halalkalibacter nanhaiisediminis]|uniref:SUKH superfamily protein n=1 Tax=Halalkalibacter nanhaiisediminis TaxID=688079 RepID=A0A562QF50_9BACI|nr:SMI1/KNR4 family protein [Halalkalibacter nanhaiisediminis]TWI54666.1 SUKH superfamily protein [Halalkalibacter nanhaiisediminis]